MMRHALLLLVLFLGPWPLAQARGQVSPEARIHPSVILRDAEGRNVLETGHPVSPLVSCGDCHDTDFISTHSVHTGPGLLASSLPAAAVSRRMVELPDSAGAEMNCFLCHTPYPSNQARLRALAAGDGAWAASATLSGVGITLPGPNGGWRWNPAAFDARGQVLDTLLAIQGPTSANCAQCHGVAIDDPSEPVVLGGIHTGSLMTVSRGEVFSPQHISESGVNIEGKEGLDRPWDIHAERLLACDNCHFSSNNPIFRQESPLTQPEGLTFDSRRMPLGAYLQRPSHNFAGQDGHNERTRGVEPLACETCHDPEPTHRWLPYAKRHTDAMSCEVCHTPSLYAVAVESVDWTTLDGEGVPDVTWRGCAAGCETASTDLVRGFEPAILLREDGEGRGKLAPYNLVTSWYWADGSGGPVDLDLIARASELESGQEAVAGHLREAGVVDPHIVGEIKPYPVHHGVTGGEWATRECKSCHGEDSRLARPVSLADRAPGGVTPVLVEADGERLLGEALIRADGSVAYRPRTSEAGLYVLGHDAVGWANLLGIMAILATILGVAVHGGLRWWAARRRPPGPPEVAGSVYMYSTYERVWHWLQALAILILLLTGVEIHVASLGLMEFGLAVRLHNIVGFVVLANAIFAAFFHLASGEIQQYLPRPRGFFGQAITQARFYLSGIFRGEPHPFEKSPTRKLNPLQQITYLGILNVLLPLQVVTGILIWGVQRWPLLDTMMGGLTFLAPLHAFGAWMFAAFLLMHVYLTTTGPTPVANMKAMVVGWDLVESTEGSSETP